MTPHPRSPARPRGPRSLPTVLRGLGSLLLLLAAVGGLPILLAWATPVLWRSSEGQLVHLLDRQDTGGLFLLVLLAVAWGSWAHFVFCVAAEIPAQLRGRTRAPGGWALNRRAAATLVGGILMLLPAGTALATPAPAAAAAEPHSPAADPPQPEDQQERQNRVREAEPQQRLYTVREMRPAESLWSIAERELGDGERWVEIADANAGRTMPDGALFSADEFLQPGWVLHLPDSGPAPQGGRTAESVTVRPGDSLSGIAERELGDASRWPQIFEENRGEPQPGGKVFTDPDRIYPGQELDLPASAKPGGPGQHDRPPRRDDGSPPQDVPSGPPAPEAPPSAEGTGEDGSKDGGGAEAGAETTPQGPGQPRDGAGPEVGGGQESRRPAPPDPQESRGAPEADRPDDSADEGGISGRVLGGIGVLLASVLVAGIALKRILQQRRRKPGETIAMPAETSRLEQALTTSADQATTEFLDRALRTLAHHVVADGAEELPGLRGARVTAATVEILPEDLTAAPLPPFGPGEDGWWTLTDRERLLPAEEARDVAAPYPGLVTVGSGEDGSLYLVNLPQAGAVLLEGPEEAVQEVCTAVVLEAGMSPWADQAEILVTGCGAELPRLLPAARVRHVPSLGAAVRDLGERMLEAHQEQDPGGVLPWMLICATRAEADEAWQLAEALEAARSLPVAVVLPARETASLLRAAEVLRADAREAQHVQVLGARVQLQRVEADVYRQLVATLAVAEEPARPATGDWQHVPSEPARTATPSSPSSRPAPDPGREGSGEGGGLQGDAAPALLAAVQDPSALRLLPAPAAPGDDQAQSAADPGDTPGTPGASGAVPGREDAAAAAREGSGADKPAAEPVDLHSPEIRVLGPLEVPGLGTTGHGPRLAALAALLYFRPGRDAGAVCEAMDPVNPWSTSTLTSRMHGLRSRLGTDPQGLPYVPRRSSGSDPYRLHPAVRCDWDAFRRLASRGLKAGPAGLPHLENALALVRGRPFGSRPPAWAAPLQQEMISRIVDVAHTVALYRRAPGPDQDLDAARRALAVGIECEETAEVLYRGWMLVEHAAGSRSGLHTAITRLQQVMRHYDLDLEPETEELIAELLADQPRPVRRAGNS
ncbi:LysM peptidoglycan-binding domain-containing protein [Streptomyces xinghaiensis]|uniref:LysM peptidoglycan-binding domain-containing protein n=1 Tax=Streptomyces xinghaiensis TaxID=1038928 RepID=UPI0002EF2D50|nr:LysM peptidoglycan-binding domain-containing protein [Streptomyces xinghaiensis]MZE80901.1 LysM peptidoglycan-binding domain-containing protein [Streptomyces sp. SID5475]